MLTFKNALFAFFETLINGAAPNAWKALDFFS